MCAAAKNARALIASATNKAVLVARAVNVPARKSVKRAAVRPENVAARKSNLARGVSVLTIGLFMVLIVGIDLDAWVECNVHGIANWAARAFA